MPKKYARSKPRTFIERRRGLYFDKRIGLDTIVGVAGIFITLGIPILIWGRAMESRILNLEVTKVEREKSDVIGKADEREQRAAMLTRLDKLDEKVTQMQIQLGGIIPFGRESMGARIERRSPN